MILDPIHILIAVLASFLVTEGAKVLAERRGIDLSPAAAQITASLVALVVLVVDPLLAQIPATAAPYIVSVVNLALVILSAFGLHRSAVRFGGRLT